VITVDDHRGSGGRRGYRRVPGVLPRRVVVEVVAGVHHVDGELNSGGWWLRWLVDRFGRAREFKLACGMDVRGHEVATDGIWEVEMG